MAERDAAIFEANADADSELLLAALAAPEESAVAFASLAVGHLVDIHVATAGAVWSVSPTSLFKELDRSQFVRAGQWNLADDFADTGSVAVLGFAHGIAF